MFAYVTFLKGKPLKLTILDLFKLEISITSEFEVLSETTDQYLKLIHLTFKHKYFLFP